LLTETSAKIGSSGSEGVVSTSRGRRPHVGVRSFDQNQARPAEYASVESTACQGCPAFRAAGTEEEKHGDEHVDQVDWNSTEPFARVRGGDGRKEHPEHEERHAENGSGHADAEFFHDLRNGHGV
jgi:hypothetical protein